jgi:predicted XRE-type DNA-binding protein
VERGRLELLSALMIALTRHIKARGWSQKEAAARLGVTQPRISDLMRGHIDLFSLDSAVRMLAKAGLRVDLRVDEAA